MNMKNCNENQENFKPHNNGNKFAIILIIVGTVALLSKLNVFSAPIASVIFSWQMLLICIGLYKFIQKRIFMALLTFFVGAFFIIPKIAEILHSFITDLPQNYVGTFCPLLVIAAGITIILHRVFPGKYYHNHFPHHPHGPKSDTWKNDNGFIFKKSAFQSSEHIILDPEFKGGEVECTFGEVTIDLRRTTLQEGTSVLDIKVGFGAITPASM